MRNIIAFALPVLLAMAVGCAAMRNMATYNPPPSVPASTPVGGPLAAPAAYQSKIMTFGGEGHKSYLGCLNCSETAIDSVKNPVGTHGSVVGAESILNHVSAFGSAVSPWSACNVVAIDPPVIVDENGNYYGRLTLNIVHPEIGAGSQFIPWLKTVC